MFESGPQLRKLVSNLSDDERIGLIFDAHTILIEILDEFFDGSRKVNTGEIAQLHLSTRHLIEELWGDDGLFEEIWGPYYCPFRSLYEITDGSQCNWTSRRKRLMKFHAFLAELYFVFGRRGRT